MIPATRARIVEDLTGRGAQKRTADEARALQQALLDTIRKNKEIYTTRQNWKTGYMLTKHDSHWVRPVLVDHHVSAPRATESDRSPIYAIRYDFMPYAIVEYGANQMACRILRLEIPAPRDPFLPPPGLTTEEVLDSIIRMTKSL